MIENGGAKPSIPFTENHQEGDAELWHAFLGMPTSVQPK